jgi:hypothetical protein
MFYYRYGIYYPHSQGDRDTEETGIGTLPPTCGHRANSPPLATTFSDRLSVGRNNSSSPPHRKIEQKIEQNAIENPL